ncbi:MAG: tetratricopeptide repeat protein, partial [Myxococcota bacterium]|nr:tetratricopeptide repeat protein [Myxococcota bacterium]
MRRLSLLGLLVWGYACGPKTPQEVPVEVAEPVVELPVEDTGIAEEVADEGAEDTGVVEEAEPEPEPEPLDLEKIAREEVKEALELMVGGEEADLDRAVSILEAVRARSPEFPEVVYNLGVIHHRRQALDDARLCYRQATSLDPTLGVAWYNLGALDEQEGAFESALAIYRQGLGHAPDDSALVAGVIGVLRKLGRLDEAIAEAKAALVTNANNIRAYDNLGLVYLDQGNFDLAWFIYQKALNGIEGADQDAMLHGNLGRVYLAMGKSPQAQAELEKALELDASLVLALMQLSQAHMDDRNWESTVEFLERARDIEPDNPAIHQNLGIAYRGVKRYDEAKASYQKALDLDPSNPDPYLNLAVIHGDHLQEFESAIEALDNYVANGGTDEERVAAWMEDIEGM